MTDPIADLLTRIRNGLKARHPATTVPYSKLKESVLKIMKRRGFIRDMSITRTAGKTPEIKIIFSDNARNLNLRRVSKSGQRIYMPAKDLRAVHSGFGISIISTSQGVMTGSEARRKKIGGEVLCEIY